MFYCMQGKIWKTEEEFLPASAGILPFLDVNSLMRKIDELGEKVFMHCSCLIEFRFANIIHTI